ncbi:MAG: (2Fe-2S)-binding protein [Gammaproteobacteria bacterium]|nr:(2Fe-2S)-binding protein [Gammaproteobacteria bacterium]
MVRLSINGVDRELDMDPATPLLWALRDGLRLTGTKYSCGIAQCGACLVLVDGKPVHSCTTPISSVMNRKITTIEGLSADRSHPVQQAWIEQEVPQCGYCHSGQILAAAALLEKHPQPSDTLIDEVMREVLCRCGTYPRIRKAIKRAAELAQSDKEA